MNVPRRPPIAPVRAGTLIVLTTAVQDAAANAPCQPPPAHSRASLGIDMTRTAAFDAAPAHGLHSETHRMALTPGNPSPEATRPAFGYRHDYTTMTIKGTGSGDSSPAPTMAGNGHFHRLAVPVDLSPLLESTWQLRIQPALAVTSNLLKNTSRIDSESWQFNAALLKVFPGSGSTRWLAGVCGDHRFGDYRLYPSVAWQWRQAGWSVHLGYPDNRISVRLGDSLTLGIRLFPGGRQWRVYDDTLGHSRFSQRAWQARTTLDWRFADGWQIETGFGKLLDNEYSFTRRNGVRWHAGTDSPFRFSLELSRQY